MAAARPMKTLEEREAAYAEARLRIMGPEPAGAEAAAAGDRVQLQAKSAG